MNEHLQENWGGGNGAPLVSVSWTAECKAGFPAEKLLDQLLLQG